MSAVSAEFHRMIQKREMYSGYATDEKAGNSLQKKKSN
jgi:hypothetical protein